MLSSQLIPTKKQLDMRDTALKDQSCDSEIKDGLPKNDL